MKILIVDDNANNRMLLSLLVQEYNASRQIIECEIDECANGLEALNKSQEIKYDLIFMDIMMPVMDGIEATTKIREHDKEVMIIAVSAVDDDKRQKEILRCGAEDYVSKPLDTELLYARLENYFSLLPKRHQIEKLGNEKSVNLYTKEVFHRQTIFYVENDEALSEFWEYYLLGDESTKVDGLSDVVRAVYALGDAVVKASQKPWIIVEADNDAIYFTLNKLDAIDESIVKLIMQKNKEVKTFKSSREKISFRLEKIISIIAEEDRPSFETVKAAETMINVKDQDIQIAQTNIQEYQVFNYMDHDDLLDMYEYLGDLSSLMLMLGSSRLNEDDIQQIAGLLDVLGKRLRIYTQSFPIGKSLLNLSSEIFSHMQRFMEIEKDLSDISGAFVSDLQTWAKMTFEEGAPSADFMNDTIVANTQTIISMLKDDGLNDEESDLDDIFDF